MLVWMVTFILWRLCQMVGKITPHAFCWWVWITTWKYIFIKGDLKWWFYPINLTPAKTCKVKHVQNFGGAFRLSFSRFEEVEMFWHCVYDSQFDKLTNLTSQLAFIVTGNLCYVTVINVFLFCVHQLIYFLSISSTTHVIVWCLSQPSYSVKTGLVCGLTTMKLDPPKRLMEGEHANTANKVMQSKPRWRRRPKKAPESLRLQHLHRFKNKNQDKTSH